MARNRLTYLLVIAVMVLLVYLYEDAITYVALYAVLGLPLISLGLALASRRRLTIAQWLASEVISKGEQTQYVLNVGNNGFLPLASVRARFGASSEAVVTDFEQQYFSLKPRGAAQVVFEISAKYRGRFEIGLADMVMYDFLGIFAFKQDFGDKLVLEVRPRIVAMDYMPLAIAQGGIEGAKNLKREEDYAIISDLRKYQPTDGYKKIHWKVSAKKNELISKNFQSAKRSSTLFILDNSKIGGLNVLEVEDMMMEACVSSIHQAVNRGQVCALTYLGMAHQEDHSGNFDFLYLQACGIPFEGFAPRDFETFFSNFSKLQGDTENLVILVKKITDGVFVGAQNLKLLGSNVILIYFEEPRREHLDKIAILQELDVACIDFRGYYYDGEQIESDGEREGEGYEHLVDQQD